MLMKSVHHPNRISHAEHNWSQTRGPSPNGEHRGDGVVHAEALATDEFGFRPVEDRVQEFESRANLFGVSIGSPDSHRPFIEFTALPAISDTRIQPPPKGVIQGSPFAARKIPLPGQ